MHRRSFLQARGDRRPSRPCGRARDPLPLPDFEAIVRVFLNAKPCVRPSAEEIARAAGWSARELRRSYERIDRILGSVGVGNGNAIRRMLTWSCLRYAADLITGGTKVTAASRLAGFHHNGSFARQFKMYFGCDPSDSAPQEHQPLPAARGGQAADEYPHQFPGRVGRSTPDSARAIVQPRPSSSPSAWRSPRADRGRCGRH